MDKDLNLSFRSKIIASDAASVREITKSSGFFEAVDTEIDEAVADVVAAGENTPDSDTYIFAELDDRTVGFVSYGLAPCCDGLYNFYWIAVRNDIRGAGIGKKLMARAFEDIKARGGRKAVLQTSGRPQYLSTRKFYEKTGFILEAQIADYYTLGESCCFYSKTV